MNPPDEKMLPVGKLPLEYLRLLLADVPGRDSRLLIGPQIGEDAAVIDAGDRYLVVATDPITFATDQIGRYAVHDNANDVAVLGARPLWFFVVILLPERRTTPELAAGIMTDVRSACEEPGVTLAAADVGDVVHGMHDPTEGGLATGLFELVAPAGHGLRVFRERIEILPETDTICRALALDPLKLIASGALLIAVAPDGTDAVLAAIQRTGVPVGAIGEVRPPREGLTIVKKGAVEPFTPPARDEIARAFESDRVR